MQIDSITIENYRSIGKFNISQFSPITVFVGRNNTGKSSFLETLTLSSTAEFGWYDALGEDVLNPILRKRGRLAHSDLMIKLGSDFSTIDVIGDLAYGKIEIVKILDFLDETSKNVIISGINNYIEEFVNRNLVSRSKDRFIGEEDINDINKTISEINNKIWKNITINLLYKSMISEKMFYASIVKEGLREDLWEAKIIDRRRYIPAIDIIRSTLPRNSKTLFHSIVSKRTLLKMKKELTLNGEILNVIDYLKNKIEYLSDIRSIENSIFVFLKDFKIPFPLNTMGDGFISQLSILFSIAIAKNGVIILEEPEIRLHPGYMNSIAEQICNNSKNENVQYFISTHSSEFLEYLLNFNRDIVQVIRTYRIDHKAETDYEILSGAEAIEEIEELKLDLRGP